MTDYRYMFCNPRRSYLGFTLIEMAIVLVIIGLIAAGVLLGQDLIKSAQLRSQAAEFQKYNAAVNVFQDKYNCFPGDCKKATTYFPTLNNPNNAYQNGNGDGLLLDAGQVANAGVINIQNTIVSNFPFEAETEPLAFWVHLFEANLTLCCDPANVGANVGYKYIIGQSFPQDKVNGGGIGVASMNGANGYYWGIQFNSTTCCPNGNNAQNYAAMANDFSGVLTTSQAQAFDTKIDDGLAQTGNVYVAFIYGGDNLVHPQNYAYQYNCLTNTTPPAYNFSYSGLACDLWINMQAGAK